MSSPPPPPSLQTPSNPLKRLSVSSASQGMGSAKRPRMHPLRQTSFPNTIDSESRLFSTASDAGSVTGSFTGSLGGTSADGVFSGAAARLGGKKRGRKSKAEKEREREDAMSARGGLEARMGSVDGDGGSVRGAGGAASTVGAGGHGHAEDGDDDDDFDDEGELLGGEEGTTDTEADKKNLAVLVDAFNPIQSERYDLFKRAKLRKETLRRIVNHALSQSVPASVVTTINGFTKVYAGEIIEKARTVQAEWALAHDQAAHAAFQAEVAAAEAAAALKSTPDNTIIKSEFNESGRATPSSNSVPPRISPLPTGSTTPYTHSVYANGYNTTASPAPPPPGLTPNGSSTREFKPPPNPHRGQLLPSHLREALRRYKRDCEGGGVGFSGLSMDNLGVKGSLTWSSGSWNLFVKTDQIPMRRLSNPSSLYTRVVSTLPWSGEKASVKGDPRKSVKWIDGLRGVASFLVVLTHLARGWDYDLFSPRDGPDIPPRILQLPVLRIPWQGRVGVTIFAFLTGYVCALKPLKQSHTGDTNAAFTTVAKSAFRRPPRLILPATIALVISWAAAQCGAYTAALRSDCWWCRYAAPKVKETWWLEVYSLGMNFLSTWTTGYMAYDDHQWALLPLLKGSMLVYLVLVATMFVRFRWRMLVYVGMVLYFHQDSAANVETIQMQCMYGMLLCDLSYNASFKEFVHNHTWGRRLISIPLAILGLLIASYPGEHPEWSEWSNEMWRRSSYLFPPNVNVGKRYTAIGIDMVICAIYLSPSAKDILSNRLFLWFGKQSFAVYLVHGTLLRTVLVWMLYGITGQPWEEVTDAEGTIVPPPYIPIRPAWVVFTCIPVWIVIVYICATLWTGYVDPFCASLTQKLENLVFEEDLKSQPPLPLVSVPMPTT
ncbi:hypothetical protein ASPZODRAFT_14626 [Penicilliopsis zonata CBS 506.65]|uniref:TAFII28-like protein domain-containing protein n=1 Tax=Penicilliopsis zonata CBS 506.65 TaxID=1073090 RepID=A0A1L9SN16_9EURO|nr:hypothetical protein ASPZODRAFT_14626 [Penicilliopsis zonata CBS 506.65]OJJ48491.1 hypothetical protein ASPZODRAFT_14626 [Penicilliopsis zonata CBS 506.65]